jgi:hypothetical protein
MSDSPNDIRHPPWRAWAGRHRGWLIVGLILLFVAGVRFHLRSIPLERDEGEYAYAGQLMLQGEPPYKDVYNMKLPGTYAAYALIMALFGQTPSAIHFGLMLVNMGSIALMFLIGRALLDETTGIVAAISFALMSLSPSVLGLAGHATQFVVLPALGGILLLIRVTRQGAREPATHPVQRIASNCFLSGLLFGLAFLMKQHGVFFGFFGGLYLVWLTIKDSTLGVRRSRSQRHDSVITLPRLLLFGFGFILPYALTCLILWGAGVFQNFVFWTFSYAGKYASTIPIGYGPDLFKGALGVVVGPNLLFWLLPWVGLASLWAESLFEIEQGRRDRNWPDFGVPAPRLFFTGLLLASFASVSVGFHFREHYFITLLPALSLLTGIAVSRAWFVLRHSRSGGLVQATPGLGVVALTLGTAIVACFGLGAAAALIGDGFVWFSSPEWAAWEIYKTKIYVESAAMADYIKTHSSPNAKVAVIGSEPEIYFLSHRHSATGYIYTYPLVELQPYALRMQQEMMNEIERSHPEYVVYVRDPLSWLARRGSPNNIFEWWDKYWVANLELLNTVKIEQMGDQPGSDPDRYLLLLKRKGS